MTIYEELQEKGINSAVIDVLKNFLESQNTENAIFKQQLRAALPQIIKQTAEAISSDIEVLTIWLDPTKPQNASWKQIFEGLDGTPEYIKGELLLVTFAREYMTQPRSTITLKHRFEGEEKKDKKNKKQKIDPELKTKSWNYQDNEDEIDNINTLKLSLIELEKIQTAMEQNPPVCPVPKKLEKSNDTKDAIKKYSLANPNRVLLLAFKTYIEKLVNQQRNNDNNIDYWDELNTLKFIIAEPDLNEKVLLDKVILNLNRLKNSTEAADKTKQNTLKIFLEAMPSDASPEKLLNSLYFTLAYINCVYDTEVPVANENFYTSVKSSFLSIKTLVAYHAPNQETASTTIFPS